MHSDTSQKRSTSASVKFAWGSLGVLLLTIALYVMIYSNGDVLEMLQPAMVLIGVISLVGLSVSLMGMRRSLLAMIIPVVGLGAILFVVLSFVYVQASKHTKTSKFEQTMQRIDKQIKEQHELQK